MSVASPTIRVLLADDHPLVRAGLRASLASEDITLVAEATDGREAIKRCREFQPDVLLLDLHMPGPSPFETVSSLRTQCPQVRVLIVTAFDDDAYVRGLVAAGVAGYVLKDEAPETVVQAIRIVAQGGTWFSRSITAKLVHGHYRTPVQTPALHLTDRERDLLRLLTQGWDNARIAAELHLGEQTVRNYFSTLYGKLGTSSRAETIVWALSQGLGTA